MINIILNGCNGKMGHVLADMIAAQPGCRVICGFDIVPNNELAFPVYTDPYDYTGTADVLIDFSNPKALERLLPYVKEHKIPTIFATTGLSNVQLDAIKEAAKTIPVFFSANMSIGINLLIETVKKAAQFLDTGFDIEIVEKHHNQKLDAPSGTALALADSINEELDNEYEYIYDRSQVRQKREKKEIGISAVRGGTIVGDHDVIFAGTDEVITFSHRAYSKAVFAKGAVQAAKYLAGKPAGKYDMSEVV